MKAGEAMFLLALVECGVSLQANDLPPASRPVQAPERRKLAVSYRHLGCFSDHKEDRVLEMAFEANDLTTDMCCEECAMSDSAFCATQFGKECWCTADSDVNFIRHGIGLCDKWCGGDQSQTCGGNDAFDVYDLGVPERPVMPGYLGCYSDMKDDRVMAWAVLSDDMTAEVCRDHCLMEDSTTEFYATQYGSECWCGLSHSSTDFNRHGPGICHTPCTGDEAVSCGGNDAFDLFQVIDNADEYPIGDSSESETTEDPMMELILLHNAARCVHNTDPVVYDPNMALTASVYASELGSEENCGNANIPDESGLGSNIHICATSDMNEGCFSITDIMSDFYDEQVGGGGPDGWGPKGAQVLWKDTKVMGCALSACTKNGMTYDNVVCHYSPPVDYESAAGDELEYQTKTFQECGYVRG